MLAISFAIPSSYKTRHISVEIYIQAEAIRPKEGFGTNDQGDHYKTLALIKVIDRRLLPTNQSGDLCAHVLGAVSEPSFNTNSDATLGEKRQRTDLFAWYSA